MSSGNQIKTSYDSIKNFRTDFLNRQRVGDLRIFGGILFHAFGPLHLIENRRELVRAKSA